MELKLCDSGERLESIRELYCAAFPSEERKPFSLILEKAAERSMEILSIEQDGEFLGLAIMILHREIALLDYFAVTPERRGEGIGTKTLDALRSRYPDKILLLEIEDPDEPCDNRDERLRRRAFYERNRMEPMPYRVWLYGVKMLVLTDGAVSVPFERYRAIFEEVFSKKSAKNVRLA